MLARHSVRLLRADEPVDPSRCPTRSASSGSRSGRWPAPTTSPERADAVRGHALRAGALAGEAHAGGRARSSAQIRSTAVDLRRAADLLRDSAIEEREAPTEELLASVAV